MNTSKQATCYLSQVSPPSLAEGGVTTNSGRGQTTGSPHSHVTRAGVTKLITSTSINQTTQEFFNFGTSQSPQGIASLSLCNCVMDNLKYIYPLAFYLKVAFKLCLYFAPSLDHVVNQLERKEGLPGGCLESRAVIMLMGSVHTAVWAGYNYNEQSVKLVRISPIICKTFHRMMRK